MEWTLKQLREALPGDQEYKFLLHDRHKTFSARLDEEIERWGRLRATQFFFSSDRVVPRAIFKQAVGEGSAQTLAQSTEFDYDNPSFSPDRTWILFQAFNPASTASPLSAVRLLRQSAGGGRPATVVEEPASVR